MLGYGELVLKRKLLKICGEHGKGGQLAGTEGVVGAGKSGSSSSSA